MFWEEWGLFTEPACNSREEGGGEGENAGENEATRAQNSQIQIKRSRQASGIPSHLFTYHFLHSKPPFLFLVMLWGRREGFPVGLGRKRKLKNQTGLKFLLSCLLVSPAWPLGLRASDHQSWRLVELQVSCGGLTGNLQCLQWAGIGHGHLRDAGQRRILVDFGITGGGSRRLEVSCPQPWSCSLGPTG